MIECRNEEMRDRLPELASDTLEPAARALALDHIAGCAACTAEIEILRTTRLMLVAATPRVHVERIALALPTYDAVAAREGRGTRVRPIAPGRRSSWTTSWRVAAAMTFAAAGVGSYALLQPGAVDPVDSVPARVEPAVTSSGMALTGALASLSDAELEALVSDIETIEPLPSAEVQTLGAINALPILPDSIVPDMEIR